MADLRVGLVCQGVPTKWQIDIAKEVTTLVGVAPPVWIVRPALQPDFKIPSRSVACAPGKEHPAAKIALGARWPALDVVINLTRATLGPRPVQVWRLAFADDDAPGRREATARVPTTRIALVEENGAKRGLGCVRFKTARSYRRNADAAFAEARTLVARALRARAASSTALDNLATQPLDPHEPEPPPFTERLRERIVKRTTQSQWTLGIAQADPADLLSRGALPAITWLDGLPANRFFADPFVESGDADGVTLLAEDGEDASPFKGRIVEIHASRAGKVASVRSAIDLATHLSFPFVLEHDGEQYCLPEGHESGALNLFVKRSGNWERDRTLLDLPVVDPVLFKDGDTWRLFCCLRSRDDITHLYLFSAHELTAPWRSHPLNPIKSDVCGARPAGALFVVDGALYRPAQDCSTRYGGALTIHRVLRLTDNDFAEEPALRIEAGQLGKQFAGVHTLNFGNGYMAIDGLQRTSRWRRRD